MFEPRTDLSFKVGDRVRIPAPSGGFTGRIVELRGPLGPKGAQVYRVRWMGGRRPGYIEVLEEQMELLPPKKRKEDQAATPTPPPTVDSHLTTTCPTCGQPCVPSGSGNAGV